MRLRAVGQASRVAVRSRLDDNGLPMGGRNENMNSGSVMNIRLLLYGFAIWTAATILLRFRGQQILQPGHWTITLILFAISFPAMAWVVRRLCRRFQVPREQWPAGAISIALPTLLLDPFSSAFFPSVFPNISPEVAGVFGGWMLWCCAGAMAGVLLGRKQSA